MNKTWRFLNLNSYTHGRFVIAYTPTVTGCGVLTLLTSLHPSGCQDLRFGKDKSGNAYYSLPQGRWLQFETYD